MRGVASDLLALAVGASLQLPHQMRMLSLLLRLGASSSRRGDIDTILGHNRETRKTSLSRLLDFLLRFLRDAPTGRGGSSRRRRAERAGVGRRGARGRRVHGRREARGLGLGWALLEGERGEDMVGLGEGAGIQIDGGRVVEVDGDLRKLVPLGGRAGHVAIDQELKLVGTQSWGEVKRRTEKGLRDGERGEGVGRHCAGFAIAS